MLHTTRDAKRRFIETLAGRPRALLLLALGMQIVAPGICQTSNVTGSGYASPLPLAGAPGQLMTIYVQGIGASLTGRVEAQSLPLPTLLAGISVNLQQTLAPLGPIPVPLLAVFPVSSCPPELHPSSGPCGNLTGVDVQIPFELAVPCLSCGGIAQPGLAKLVVSENGMAGSAAGLNPEPDQIHVVRYGDSLLPLPSSCPASGCSIPTSDAVVTHADGSLVTGGKPAQPGETVVIYAVGLASAYGLSGTNAAATGSAAASPLPVEQIATGFDFRPNAAPSMPLNPGSPTAQAWMVVGNVGLYQINVVVPQAPPSLFPCTGGVDSNLTIDLGGLSSYDGAQICVALTPK